MGKRNKKHLKRAKLTGAASNSILAAAAARELPAGAAIKDFGGVHAVVLKGALPGAADMLAHDLENGLWKQHEHYIRDVPPSMRDLEDKLRAVRRSFGLFKRSRVARALDTGPLQQLRLALQVSMVARVGLKSDVKNASKDVKPNGRTPRQFGHFDYSRTALGTWHARVAARRAAHTSPWTLLVSLQDGGEVHIWCYERWMTIQLAAGDAVLFRGDVWHSGAVYAADHWRLHEYWVPTELDDDLDLRLNDEGQLSLFGADGDETWKFPAVCEPIEEVYVGPRFTVDEAVQSAKASLSAFPLALEEPSAAEPSGAEPSGGAEPHGAGPSGAGPSRAGPRRAGAAGD